MLNTEVSLCLLKGSLVSLFVENSECCTRSFLPPKEKTKPTNKQHVILANSFFMWQRYKKNGNSL